MLTTSMFCSISNNYCKTLTIVTEERKLLSKSSRTRASWMSANLGDRRFSIHLARIKGCLNLSLRLLIFAGKNVVLTTAALYSYLARALGTTTTASQRDPGFLGCKSIYSLSSGFDFCPSAALCIWTFETANHPCLSRVLCLALTISSHFNSALSV